MRMESSPSWVDVYRTHENKWEKKRVCPLAIKKNLIFSVNMDICWNSVKAVLKLNEEVSKRLAFCWSWSALVFYIDSVVLQQQQQPNWFSVGQKAAHSLSHFVM